MTDSSSVVNKILLSAKLKDEKTSQSEDQIDFNILATLALIYCRGDPKEKVVVFYNILQEGGYE